MPKAQPAVKAQHIPPVVHDDGKRFQSGFTTLRVSKLTAAKVRQLQELMPAGFSYRRRLSNVDDVIYRLTKHALGETAEA